MAIVHRLERSFSEPVATYGITPDLHEQLKMKKFEPVRATVAGRVLLECRAVHVPDVRSDPEYPHVTGGKNMLGVPHRAWCSASAREYPYRYSLL